MCPAPTVASQSGLRSGDSALLTASAPGGFGQVYRAYDRELDRYVAIKVPHAGVLNTPKHRERFLREARAIATLCHPHICPVHEVGDEQGVPYIVMPVVEGATLEQVLQRGERLSIDDAVHLILSVAETLAYAHSKGIVHRDLKPSNILINERQEPVLMDFGLAWRQTEGDSRLTAEHEMMGTPLYMSPEQTRGAVEATTPATDVYSLGVVLYELLAGRPPFQGTIAELIGQILHVEPVPPSQYAPNVSPALEAVVLRCLAKDPTARFASMEALIEALIHPTPRLLPSESARRAHPLLITATASVFLIALGFLLWAGSAFFARSPSSTSELLARGIRLGKEGKFAEVVQVATDALALDPQCAPAYELRARASIELGEFQNAAKDCERARQLDPEATVAYITGSQALLSLGRVEETIRVATEGLERDPELVPCYANRGIARVRLGRMEEALRDFDEVAQRAPDDARSYWYRAALHRLMGHEDQATADAERAFALRPDLRAQGLPNLFD